MSYTHAIHVYACAVYYYTHNAHAPLIDGVGQAMPSTTGLPLMLSSQASYVIVSGFRAALDLDTYPLSNLIRPRCTERLNLVFTPYLPNAVVLAKSPRFFLALVALKLLVSLISRLVACSARIVADRQTDTQNDYCNPRCACAPRVNHI